MADDRIIPVRLKNGATIHIEASDLDGGMRKVGALPTQTIDDLMQSIEGIASSFSDTLKTIKPQKASVAFGIEVGVESGKLTALIMKAGGKANLQITLEWTTTPQ